MKNLAELRKSKGFSQEQLAYQIGVSTTLVRNWEQHKVYMDKSSFRTIQELGRVLDLSPAETYGLVFVQDNETMDILAPI